MVIFVLITPPLCFVQGWTQFYEFSLSDLRAGFEIIDRLFEGKRAVIKDHSAVDTSALYAHSNVNWNLWGL